ncbi:MAG: hypothetical protein ACYCU7_11185 [Acidimicrobiales bacterium]
MELVVDLEKVTVVLAGPADTERFSVRVAAPPTASPEVAADVHRLGDVLVAAGVGRLGPSGDAYVRPDAVRFHAAGQVDDGWDDQFESMCRYAEEKGWVDADGAVQAHVEWPSPS